MPTLIEWLNQFPQVSNTREIVVTIKGKRYLGAAYRDSVFDNRDRYYLLGELPACYKRSSRTAFVIDGADWYVACYLPKVQLLMLTSEQATYHPFGEYFMLCRWQVPDGRTIDAYEIRPYNRVYATIT